MNKNYRLDGIKDLVKIAIRDDTIRVDGEKFLKTCHTPLGNGAMSFIVGLADNCKTHQGKDIVWLIDECLPKLPPVIMEAILNARFRMQLRLEDYDALNESVETIAKEWKEKGLIRPEYFPNELFKPCDLK